MYKLRRLRGRRINTIAVYDTTIESFSLSYSTFTQHASKTTHIHPKYIDARARARALEAYEKYIIQISDIGTLVYTKVLRVRLTRRRKNVSFQAKRKRATYFLALSTLQLSSFEAASADKTLSCIRI